MSNKTPIRVTGSFTPSGTQDVNIVSSITLNIAAASLPLPIGAATEATLADIEEDLDQLTFAATRLLVDGSGVTQPISGSISVSNFPAIQPVSQSGTWTVGLTTESIEIGTVDQGTGGTSAWKVDGSAVTQPISGTITANQGTSPWVVSGTITTSPNVNVHDGSGTSISSTGSSLNVDVTNTVPVTGTFFQATQPISAVSLPLPTGAATETTLAGIKTDTDKFTFASTRLLVDGSGVTQPISGIVTANAGTNLNTSALALSATQTDRTQKTQITDGTRDGTIKAASTLPLLTDTAFVTTQRDPLPAGTNVIGHVIADSGSTTAVTGNVTVVQGTGTNLHTVVDSGTIAATQSGTWNINNVSGTVSLPTGAATSANQTNASQKTQIVDGSGNVIASTSNALNVDVINFPTTSVSTASVTSNSVGSGAAVTLFSSRAARILGVIFNESGTLYVKAGSGASSADYTWRLTANTELDIAHYTGIVTAIKQSGTSNVQATDF